MKIVWFVIIGFVLAATAVYRFRGSLIRRWLDLPPVQNKVRVRRHIRVKMPDGIVLVADHYIPLVDDPQGPAILVRTPYNRKAGTGLYARRFAERGYHVVVQDTRGCFDSEGEFVPRVHETADGLATLDWIRRQRWCNGRIGMWGQSYLGFVQWAVATHAPEGLEAIVPAITTASGTGLFYPQGIFALEFVLRWMVLIDAMRGSDGRWPRWQRIFRLAPQMQNRFLRPYWRHLPLNQLDQKAIGRQVPFFQDRLSHSPADHAYWELINYHARLGQVTAACHLISGWYDFMLRDFLADYEALVAGGKAPRLTIGPWYHLQTAPVAASLREGLNWLDIHLKRAADDGESKPVRLYVMGADEWQTFAGWPPPAQKTAYYLQPDGRLHTALPMNDASFSSYRYDPADPTPSIGGAIFNVSAGSVDNHVLEARADVLTFTSPLLTDDVEVIGPVRLDLYAQTSARSADFFGRLCAVDENGRSHNVCDGICRVVPESETCRIEVDMWATAYRFRRGHRIRLQVSSGAHPRWSRNLGTGEPSGAATEMVPAEQVIFHDQKRPSALILPIVYNQ